MGSVIVDGKREEIPSLSTVTWLDTTKFKRTPNRYTNERDSGGQYAPSLVNPIGLIALHSVHGHGTGQVVQCSVGWDSAYAYAESFMRPSREASAHFIVAPAGVLQLADLARDRTWTTGAWNPFSVGIELTENTNGSECAQTIANAVTLVWWLCERFGVQPQLPVTASGDIDLGDIPRLQGDGARSFRGVAFHANRPERGAGDPGPAFGKAFIASNAEGFNLRTNQDKTVWAERQKQLGVPADGIPGTVTVKAIRDRFGRNTWRARNGSTSNAGSGSGLLALLALFAAARVLMHK